VLGEHRAEPAAASTDRRARCDLHRRDHCAERRRGDAREGIDLGSSADEHPDFDREIFTQAWLHDDRGEVVTVHSIRAWSTGTTETT
jgi:hypothetical protein